MYFFTKQNAFLDRVVYFVTESQFCLDFMEFMLYLLHVPIIP